MPTNLTLPGGLARTRHLALSISLSLLLAACNSDSGDSASTPSATELPFSVEVQGPAANNALGTAVAFSANVADPSNKLKYQWQFGDGETSTQANPAHSYAKAGVYRVQLIVTNEVGATRATTADVSVADSSITSGKLCNGENNSGWCWQKPLPQGSTLYDYFFLDEMRGWAVGKMGTIITTRDGGVTWQRQVSGTELTLARVIFVNAQDGWSVASNGAILKTNNGGMSWVGASSGVSENVQTFGASDANSAWIQDYSLSSFVSVTRDGGAHWSKIAANGYSVWKYVPVDTLNIWAFSYDSQQIIYLLHTTDGGSRWDWVGLPPLEAGMSRSITELTATDASHAWVFGYDVGQRDNTYFYRPWAWKTSNGGADWQPFSLPVEDMRSMKFVNENNGFALSVSRNILLRTNDGGLTWDSFSLANFPRGSDAQLRIRSEKQLLIKEPYGQAFKSNDGGVNWKDSTAARVSPVTLTSIWFFDSREGLATGSDGSVTRTTDGGQTWVVSPVSGMGASSPRLQFVSNGTGWMISDSRRILRSTDKGKTWPEPAARNETVIYGITDFYFLDEKNGWFVTQYPSNLASIFQTVDGGLSWLPIVGTDGMAGLQSIRFADAKNGVAVGRDGSAWSTADGGKNWVTRVSGVVSSLRRVTFIDANTAIAVGDSGSIVRSTNRGVTWAKIPSFATTNLNDVFFVSDRIGWVVGENGVLLSTRDGGLTWASQPSGVEVNFASAFFTNENTGWIVGANGTIMATTTGGR